MSTCALQQAIPEGFLKKSRIIFLIVNTKLFVSAQKSTSSYLRSNISALLQRGRSSLGIRKLPLSR